MEEEKHVAKGHNKGWINWIKRQLWKNRSKIYLIGGASLFLFLGYKAYSSTVYSSEFIKSLTQKKEVDKVVLFGLTLIFKKRYQSGWYISERSLLDDQTLKAALENNNVNYTWSPVADTTFGSIMLNVILPTVVLVWAMKKFLMPQIEKRQQAGPKREYLKFSDIGGNEAAKEALLEVADFINDPIKYQRLGIRLPRGILLYGPPGTGKTLMAKALACECQVPFTYASGADFVELYAGVGPKRVRELFATARSLGKCIIFIDEIDSLGGVRGKGNACKEFDNTLNQLLTEMDGFNGTENITVIAATNQEDHIDEALLRPGRFDRKIKIELPSEEARFDILNIHLQKRHSKVEANSIKNIAEQAINFTGADLENVVNEASFYAIKRCKEAPNLLDNYLTFEDLSQGFEKVMKEREDIELSKQEKFHRQNVDKQRLFNMFFQPQRPDVLNK